MTTLSSMQMSGSDPEPTRERRSTFTYASSEDLCKPSPVTAEVAVDTLFDDMYTDLLCGRLACVAHRSKHENDLTDMRCPGSYDNRSSFDCSSFANAARKLKCLKAFWDTKIASENDKSRARYAMVVVLGGDVDEEIATMLLRTNGWVPKLANKRWHLLNSTQRRKFAKEAAKGSEKWRGYKAIGCGPNKEAQGGKTSDGKLRKR